jgi:hypothetical protein
MDDSLDKYYCLLCLCSMICDTQDYTREEDIYTIEKAVRDTLDIQLGAIYGL